MNTKQLEPKDREGFSHWPHPVLSLPSFRQSFGDERFARAAVGAFIADVTERDGALEQAGRMETVLCPDLIENLPSDPDCLNDLWKAIKDAERIVFLIVVREPSTLPEHLPDDWQDRGYPNLCLVLETCDNADRNRENLAAFSQIPAQFRALWIDSNSNLHGIEAWPPNIAWAILDVVEHSIHVVNVEITHWVDSWRQYFKDRGITHFQNPPSTFATPEAESHYVEHPFSPEIDLRRPPLEVSHEGSRKASPPQILAKSNTIEVSLHATENDRSNRFAGLDAVVRRGFRAFVEAGFALQEIRESELWREGGHNSWAAYCIAATGFSKNYANRMISGAKLFDELRCSKVPKDDTGQLILPTNESQVRPLLKLESPQQRLRAWNRAVKQANGMPTAAAVARAIFQMVTKDSTDGIPGPSRKERRQRLIGQLRKAVDAANSWERVSDLLKQLETHEF